MVWSTWASTLIGRSSLLSAVVLLLQGCPGEGGDTASSNLGGQVAALQGAPSQVNHYAASRFLEHASLGASPDSVAQVQRLGLRAWIDAQMKLPPSKTVWTDSLINYDLQDRAASDRATAYYDTSLYNLFVGGEDQLRIRTSWVLSNFLVVSTRKIQVYGASEYFNTLQSHAFGQYGDLLKAITRSPAMGFYLDNGQNTVWSLNENYGRELMQLFSVGLVQLNPNGSIKRDIAGKALETYSQKDVIEATRALTGWNYAEPSGQRANSNNFNYGKAMVADWPENHDTRAKTLLGKNLPAGQDAYKELDSLVEILVTHPNTAPFVSLRLIQGMTTSDPSPDYLDRVSTVFTQTKGNLARVISAILLDPEARNGDIPGKPNMNFGRIKEPFLLHMNILRGLGCRSSVRDNWDNKWIWKAWTQQPLNANSVFNFYPPNHRTQGTLLLAPEQKTLNATEFQRRMGTYSYNMSNEAHLLDAGCDVDEFKSAANASDEDLVRLISERFFRGAMPAAVSQGLIEVNKSYGGRNKPMEFAGAMLDMAAMTPAFGVSK